MRTFELAGGVAVSDCAPGEILARCEAALAAGVPFHVCTVNPEIAHLASVDRGYGDAVRAADLRTIDGIGIALAVLRQHGARVGRVTGGAMVDLLAAWAARTGRDVVVVGASEASRRGAEERLRERGVRVRPGWSPRFDDDGGVVGLPADWCPAGGVVLVALNHHKQEPWIRREIAAGLPPCVVVGVGGAIDYLSGAARRPPRLVRAAGVEWLYRLVREPGRRYRRQREALPRFLWRQILVGR